MRMKFVRNGRTGRRELLVAPQRGGGLWAGMGFGNRTVFQHGHTLSEYNQPTGPTDSFAAMRSRATSVRLVEAAVQDAGVSA